MTQREKELMQYADDLMSKVQMDLRQIFRINTTSEKDSCGQTLIFNLFEKVYSDKNHWEEADEPLFHLEVGL